MRLTTLVPARPDQLVPEPVAPGTEVLRADGVEVTLGDSQVLRGVDLSVAAGEIVALVGPNGAGKSTLLGALTGDVRTTSGQVSVFGRPLQDWPPIELARRRAVLPQQVTVSFPFSVHEVVTMGRAPWGRTAAAERDAELVSEAIRAVDLAHLAHRPFPSLSGGERARAALARVIAQDTQLILLDEPTAALDLHHQELVFELAAARAAQGSTVVVVVHDLGLAAAFADRVVLLSAGEVAAEGAPDVVLTEELLGRVYHHRIEVLRHPEHGSLLVLPHRGT